VNNRSCQSQSPLPLPRLVDECYLESCRPKTGRSHQIRVHLQYAGHPIANDWQYGGRLGSGAAATSGSARGPAPASTSQAASPAAEPTAEPAAGPAAASLPAAQQPSAAADAGRQRGGGDGGDDRAQPSAGGMPPAAGAAAGCTATVPPALDAAACAAVLPPRQHAYGEADERERAAAAFLVDEADRDPACDNCPSLIPRGWPTALTALWLHAHTYACDEWSFTCPAPDWAREVVPQMAA